MSEWLDELKEQRTRELELDAKGLFAAVGDHPDYERFIDRLIEIAERTEWSGFHLATGNEYCPLCYEHFKHAKTCPYSDSYKKE